MLEHHFIHPSDMGEALEKKKDILMIYCPSCGEKVEVPISHPDQNGSHHQAINLLPEIAVNMKWNKMDVVCKKCCLVLHIDPVVQDRQRVEVQVKINCEGMSPGMDSWYEEDVDPMDIERSLHTL